MKLMPRAGKMARRGAAPNSQNESGSGSSSAKRPAPDHPVENVRFGASGAAVVVSVAEGLPSSGGGGGVWRTGVSQQRDAVARCARGRGALTWKAPASHGSAATTSNLDMEKVAEGASSWRSAVSVRRAQKRATRARARAPRLAALAGRPLGSQPASQAKSSDAAPHPTRRQKQCIATMLANGRFTALVDPFFVSIP